MPCSFSSREAISHDHQSHAHRSRKSGKNFVAPLLYITDRNNVIVVASALGQAENPQWYRNLPPNPDTHIQIGSDRRPSGAESQLAADSSAGAVIDPWVRSADTAKRWGGAAKPARTSGRAYGRAQ